MLSNITHQNLDNNHRITKLYFRYSLCEFMLLGARMANKYQKAKTFSSKKPEKVKWNYTEPEQDQKVPRSEPKIRASMTFRYINLYQAVSNMVWH